jgi:preprotein translocase subunit SecE
VARDRDRAKARRAERKAAADGDGRGNNPGPRASEPHREQVPGSLDHASGEVDEVEAVLITGADGEPVDDAEDGDLEREAVAAAPGSALQHAAGTTPTTRGPGRFMAFLRASWAELQRVQWPDRHQVGQGTAVVLGFVVIAGLYLGVADRLAQEVVDLIL